jgi:ABC-type taurine transport system substrate-binding protein
VCSSDLDYATNNGEVQWSADWRAVAVGENVVSGGSSGTIDFGDVNIPASANTLVKTTGIIAAANISQNDLIALNGSRIALDDGSNPASEPYILMINIEYTANKLGEAT